MDSADNIYIGGVDYHIRKVGNGTITTVAGNGKAGYSGDNGSATAASLNTTIVAVDSASNLYIADNGNHRIRRVSNGVITTVAGNGTAGFSGDNGPATSAEVENTLGICVDSGGNVFIFDDASIREISNGIITSLAVLGSTGGIAVDNAGNVYLTGLNDVVRISAGVSSVAVGNGYQGYSGDNGPAKRH